VSEVIYKYRKQQEAEHLHEQEVIILLCTHRPIMMGVWMGCTLLSGALPMRKRIPIGYYHANMSHLSLLWYHNKHGMCIVYSPCYM